MALVLRRDDTHIYFFLTGLLAVVGGVFAIAGLAHDILKRISTTPP